VIVNSLWGSLLILQHTAANSEFRWDLLTMWHYMGIPGRSVVTLLFITTAWSVGIMINRALMFSAARKQPPKP
jgi:hypothetical protein